MANIIETKRRDKRQAGGDGEPQPRREHTPAPSAPPLRARPANENDPGTSVMLARLRRPPSYTPYYVAFVLALGWVAGWFFIFSNSLLGAPAPLGAEALPETTRAVALLVLPIAVIWVAAYFLWRAAQLRHVSEVLMQSAMRLIRPQDLAAEGLTTIAQAVRSEVDLLVGGVEHAVQRATVLEEIVHKEISAVERAFGGNEERIRGLVSGLENQRSALHQAGLIINNDTNPLLTRLETNTKALDGIVGEAQTVLSRIEAGLKETTANLSRTIDDVAVRANAASDEIGGQTTQMERMSGALLGELNDFSRHLQGQIDTLGQSTVLLTDESLNFGKRLEGMETNVVQAIDRGVERLSAINEDIGRNVERAAVASADQIRQTANDLTEVIETTGGNLTYHLKETASGVGAAIERTGQDVSQQIEESRGLVTQGLQTVAADYLDKVAQTRSEIVAHMDRSSAEVVQSVEQTTANLTERLGATSGQFLESMERQASHLLGQLDATGAELAGRVEQTTTKLFDEIGDKAGLIVQRLDDTAANVFSSLEERSNASLAKVTDTATRVLDAIDQQNESVVQKIGDTAANFQAAFSDISASLNGQIDEVSGRVAARFGETTDRFNALIGGSAEDLEARIDGAAERLYGHMSATLTSVAGKIGETADAVRARLEGTASGIASQLQSTGTSINDALVEASGTIVAHLKESTEAVSDRVRESGTAVDELLTGTSGTIVAHLKETSAIVNRQMQESGIALAQSIDNSGGLVTEKLISVSGDFVHKIGKSRDELSNLVAKSSDEMARRLEDTAHQLHARLDGATSGMTGRLESTASNLYERLDEVSAGMTGQIEATAARIADRIDSTASEVTAKVATVTGTLTHQLDTSSGLLGELLESTASRLDSRLGHASDELSRLFNTNTRLMTEQLDKTSTGISALFGTNTRELTERLDRSSEELSSLINANTRMMADQLNVSATEMTNAFAETAVRVTSQVTEANALIAERLEKTAGEVTHQLDSAGHKMFERIDTTARDLGQRFDVASSLLERVTDDMSGRLEGTSSKFAEIIDTASSQILSGLDKASGAFTESIGQTTLLLSGRLERETGLLVDGIERASKDFDAAATATAGKLDDAHKKFSRHVETANTYLADQLVSAASSIDERLEGISMQLTGKLELTGSRLAERLGDVSGLVERSVDKFNDEMERVLVSRREALDTLIGDTAKRATEIDAVMTSYMHLIEESLDASETRAKEIARVVAEQSAAAAANLDTEIERLEASSGGQIAQAARILREQHERSMQSMNEMLSATASDFQQTAQDMRITAQQVVKEIDTARNELKRAILDLPDETRSNADAMRRVVGDQIAALNALADVVKRQAGGLDLSGPGIMLPRGLRDPSPGKSEGATVYPAAARAPGEFAGGKARGPAIAREVEAFVDKLNAAARNLVQTIDGGLPADLEKSYGAGERNVYTRRLYESRGRKFSQILKSRYDGERPLKSRVDDYLQLFEQMLGTMHGQPQGDTLVEASFASESGRIYVMLAEAAGPHSGAVAPMRRLTVARETWPVAGRFTISRDTRTSVEVVVVTLAEDGVEGRGECRPYARYGESPAGVVAALEAARGAIEDGCSRAGVPRLAGPRAARNALDCALWDLEAKKSGVPVWRLAGLARPEPLVTAYTLSLDTPRAMAEAAARAKDRPLLKLKLGAEGDAERLHLVRAVAPTSLRIVDANEGWTAEELPSLLAVCAEAGVELVEQPLPAAADETLRGIVHAVPICADESAHDSDNLAGLAGKYDAVNIKLDKAGGLTAALAMARAAQRQGFSVMAGCMLATSLAMAPAMLAAQFATVVDLDGPLLLARDREHGIRFAGSTMLPASPLLWG